MSTRQSSPDEFTKFRLFAASGGYCQSPACARPLFLDTGSRTIHIAEIAHVFAAQDDGPRANKQLAPEERGSFDNLILLCSACHTIIDKSEKDYPDSLIKTWKRDHAVRLMELFGATSYGSRAEVRYFLEPLLDENYAIHRNYNPDLDYRYNPESDMAVTWQRNMRERVIPNNRRILATLDANRVKMVGDELATLEEFRQHIYDLEARHFTDAVIGAQRRFPLKMSQMMAVD